jgi:thiaminase
LHGIYKVRSSKSPTLQHLLKNYRYVLDIGHSEDWLALQISMAPCLIGYGVIANRLYDDPNTKREGNLYWSWIKTYVAEDYTEAVKVGTGT